MTAHLRPAVPAATGGGLRELRRQQRLATNRTHVLDVAERLFARLGYRATSIEDIAAGSEFSVGAVYKLFGGKEEIFRAVLNRRGPGIQQLMADLPSSPGTAEQRLRHIVTSVIGYFRAYPDYGRLSSRLFSLSAADFPHFPEMRIGIESARHIYAGVIEQGQHEGSFRAGNPQHLAAVMIALISTQTQLDPEISGDPSGIDLDDYVEIILGALRA